MKDTATGRSDEDGEREIRVRPKFLRRGVGRIVVRGRLTLSLDDDNGSPADHREDA